MKRKLLLRLTATVCAFTCAFGLTACNNVEHTHDYAAEWKTSATHHWRECKNDGCDAKEKDKAAHADNNGDGKCDTCDYNMGNGSQTVAVEGISLNRSTLTLNIDGEETLTATVAPENAMDKTVTWSSSAPTVASVDSTGKVTAKAEGTATITATTANDKTATCTVTVNAPASATEVTAEEWTQIMDSATKFTLVLSQSNAVYATIKVDGDMRSQNNGRSEQIFVKDGTDYSQYTYYNSTWIKSTLSESDYTKYTGIYSQFLKFFKDDYSLFTYTDGKYTAASIDKTATMNGTLTNVEATFENGVLIGLSFTINTYKYETKDVGTTTITLPTDYTENTPAPSLAGKTFAFSDMTCDSMTTEELAETKTRNEGMTVTFHDNGTVTITQLSNSIIQTGTYALNGETVNITITSMTMNGNPIEVGEGVPVQGTYDGDKLVLVSQIGADTVAYSTFVLQTANSIHGTYNMVIQSSTGWTPTQDFGITFNRDGTCTMESAGTYVVENNVITLSFGSDTYYAVIDGNILWIFENKEDTNDINKSIQHFYNGIEINSEDRAKMVAVFGDGIVTDKPDQSK